jgi:hypothetical protein
MISAFLLRSERPAVWRPILSSIALPDAAPLRAEMLIDRITSAGSSKYNLTAKPHNDLPGAVSCP